MPDEVRFCGIARCPWSRQMAAYMNAVRTHAAVFIDLQRTTSLRIALLLHDVSKFLSQGYDVTFTRNCRWRQVWRTKTTINIEIRYLVGVCFQTLIVFKSHSFVPAAYMVEAYSRGSPIGEAWSFTTAPLPPSLLCAYLQAEFQQGRNYTSIPLM